MNTGRIVILGQFDGVHLAHRVLIEKAVHLATEEDKKVYLISFSGNYKNEVLKKTDQKLLLYDEEKKELLKSLGVDKVILLPFSYEIRNMSPKEFTQKIVIEKYNASNIFCGFNYHFGKNAKGNAKELESIAKNFNIKTFILPAVKIDRKEVSSSMIKKLLSDGKLKEANQYLGYEYKISGEVVFGNQIGRTIGFKTANLLPPKNKIIPINGVYQTVVNVKNNRYESMTNIGKRPTVDGKEKIIETNIFAFDKDIYGEKISISFKEKIRDEIQFSGLGELKNQLKNDKLKVKELFKKNKERI
ncbi:MAG: bifunctional riboflavin kinase/FAD synthetase [Clostridiales Family XIII bacterium]|jgi:riboflavin kinase/FMN adenylyltransferase|nr:bifunctional riboflavin kinase/FAD synthetase [Clostridiales Family XIII bacterium]